MNRTKVVVASIAVAALISQNAAGMAEAAATNTKANSTKQTSVKTLNNLAGVNIGAKSTVKLTNINILSQDEGNILTYTLTYHNNGSTALSLLDYWSKVKTNSGIVYNVTAISSDKDKKKVVPGASVTITYTTKIAKGLKYSDLNFQVLKWNFGVSGYEQVLGTIKIPASYVVTTPVNTSRKINFGEYTANAKVTSVNVIGLGAYNYVSVVLLLHNLGSKTIENPNLKYVVQTASGTPFALTADASSSSYQIYPQENKSLNLIAKIPKTVNLENLQLLVVQNDETSKADLPLATMNLGTKKGQNSVTAVNKEKVLKINNSSVSTRIDSVSRNQSFGQSNLSIQFALTNKGDQSITMPNYTFEIQSGSKSYSLTVSGLEGTILGPGEEQIFSVDGTIPVIANSDQLELILKTPSGTSSSSGEPGSSSPVAASYPIAGYKLPDYIEMQHAIGEERIVKNNDGTFGVTLDAIQKLPWEDGNILATKITITNKGSKAAKLPEFAGSYKLDLTALSGTVQLINSNTTQILGVGEKASVYVAANVPSSLNFSQLQVQLLQKIGADKTSSWVMFSNYGKTSDLSLIADGSFFNLDTAGKKSDLQTRKTYLYKGSTNDIIYTELIMKNRENKQTVPPQLTGYFLTDQGQYYKAEANQVKRSVGPEAASIVSFSAKVPKGTVVSNWKLVIGESITENKFTVADAKPTGYVNASAMELNLESRDIKNTLKDIQLFPYNLTVNEVVGNTSSSGLQLKLKYDLSRDLAFEMDTFQHKFVLEVVDSSGARFEKEIELEKDFIVGGNQSYSYVINDPIFATSRTGGFQFSIYDAYQGEKTKIATQSAYYSNSSLFE
ncbi:hypothetical protein [Paenibacillus timonensis]|uniref:hypothetical protein n=1 Tax=Paenibacillus timonensis TaxID=225915 RepID=UPI0022E5C9E9|nr:hypothetical protein [Paenibacillus timonensis]